MKTKTRKKITIEYMFGFCEPCKSPVDAAKKVIAACCLTDPPKPIRGGLQESTRRGGCFSITYYERNWNNEKHFVARISGSEDDIHQVIRLTPDYSGISLLQED